MQISFGQRLGVIYGCAAVLILTGQAAAQANRRPSEIGPSEVLYQTLNRVTGSRMPAGFSLGQLGRGKDVATINAPPAVFSPFKRSGRAGVGYVPLGPQISYRNTGTSLIARRYGSSSLPMPTYSNWGGPVYPELTRQSPGLLLRRPDLVPDASDTESLAVVPLHDTAASQPAGDLLPQGEPTSLHDLVRDYVETRRSAYLRQGWEHFRQREYRIAGDLFGLAANVCLDEPAVRSEVEIARLFASVAANQYSQAADSLRWLLSPNRRTGELPDPEFLTKLSQIESRYADRNEFHTQVRNLEAYAIANPDAVEIQALRSVLLLVRGDRVGAIYHARRIPKEAPAPWPSLQPLLERSGSAPAAPTAAAGGGTAVSSAEQMPILLPHMLATKQ